MISLLPKLAGETRRYRHDWSPFLGLDTISSESTSIAGATLVSTTIDVDNRSVIFKVSGGVAGVPATIAHEITTAGGDIETEVFSIPIGADEPVTLREAKAQVRMLEDDSEDEFLLSLISSARAFVERRSRFLFVSGTRTETFARWGDYLEIWRRPITSIDTIEYSTTDDPADDAAYTGFVTNLGFPARISAADGDDFPDLLTGGTITVSYTAGALAVTDEAYLIGKRAILLLIGFWYDNRGEGPLTEDQERTLKWCLEELGPVSAY
jgi:uncharacterized phiE125 gp8 family phage protein